MQQPRITRLCTELGYPALETDGHAARLVGYFQGETGTISQLVHLWKFDTSPDHASGVRTSTLAVAQNVEIA